MLGHEFLLSPRKQKLERLRQPTSPPFLRVRGALLDNDAQSVVSKTGPLQQSLQFLNVFHGLLDSPRSYIHAARPNPNGGGVPQQVIIVRVYRGTLQQQSGKGTRTVHDCEESNSGTVRRTAQYAVTRAAQDAVPRFDKGNHFLQEDAQAARCREYCAYKRNDFQISCTCAFWNLRRSSGRK